MEKQKADVEQSSGYLLRVPRLRTGGLRQLPWFLRHTGSAERLPFFLHGPRPAGWDTGKDHRNGNGLALTVTETATVETLTTKNGGGICPGNDCGSRRLSPADNNGTGDARTVVLDVSALGSFTSASQLTVGRGADLSNG
ncbi:MAG TPA: hypothetical protein VF749_10650, partial [Candidatus Acidoferrum sp.]